MSSQCPYCAPNNRGCLYSIFRHTGLVLVALFVIGLVGLFIENLHVRSSLNRSTSAPSAPVRPTIADYNKIQNGQTLDEVNAIIGFHGKVFSSGSTDSVFTVYQWNLNNGESGFITAGFTNGRVVSKFCYGL